MSVNVTFRCWYLGVCVGSGASSEILYPNLAAKVGHLFIRLKRQLKLVEQLSSPITELVVSM